jgi:hypothetical protein
MKKYMILMAVGVLLAGNAWAGEHRLGGGVNYWVAVDDIDSDKVDDDGFSYLASYQYMMDFIGVELDVEFLPDRFGETAVAPEAYFLLGKAIYGGVGIGIVHADGSFADDPFFALKAGLNLEVLPQIFVDISANYRFNESAELEGNDTNIDTDTIFLGAAVRFAL